MEILEAEASIMNVAPQRVARLRRGGVRRQLFALFATILSAVLFGPVIQADPPTATEYQVKAAFLYNFAKFVEWPAGEQPGSNSPIVVGVFGKDPFGTVLDQSFNGKLIGNRTLIVKRLNRIEEAKTCQILFISASEKHRLPEILEGLQRASVLTIGDMDRFGEDGGMIYLKMEGNRVRFEINLAAASRANLKISSKLLQLASEVRRKTE